MSDTEDSKDDTEYTQHQHLAESAEQTFGDRIAEYFLPVFERRFDPTEGSVAEIRNLLAQARVTTTAEMYISRTMGYGIIAGGVLWLLTTLIAAVLFYVVGVTFSIDIGVPITNPTLLQIAAIVKVPAIVLGSGAVFGIFGYLAGVKLPRRWLKMQASAREREINTLLADTISYMYALSLGGLNQMEILESVAESEDVYGEVSAEFQSVLHETEYFDVDYRSALRHRADETPSTELAQFITDMLSILSSGGDLTSFLDDKTEKHLREAEHREEDLIEMIELFGEMYLNVSLLPLLMIILLTVMKLMGSASEFMLNAVIYILIPLIGVAFLVLMSTILPDEPGDGVLRMDSKKVQTGSSYLDFSTVKKRKGLTPTFDKIYRTEVRKRVREITDAPKGFFVDNPTYILLITVPLSLILMVGGALAGIAPTSLDALFSGLWGSIYYIYVPLYLNVIPFTILYRWHRKRLTGVTDNYTESLRKLSSANDTGQTLLESYLTVANTSTGPLGDEFRAIHAKVDYNYSLREALTEFNNKYRVPEMARINNLIIDAQETSTDISEVLTTAAQTSENQDNIERQRASRTRMQVMMIVMTFFILMGVIAMLQSQFISVMGEMSQEVASSAGGGDAGGGGAMAFSAINPTKTGIKFFHAVTLQALTASVLASHLGNNTVKNAGKYILVMTPPILLIWLYLMG